MATLQTAAGSVLETVIEITTATNDVVKSLSTGARMLNDFVSHQRQQATENRALDTVFNDETRLNTKMLEIVQLREKSREYMNNNVQRTADCTDVMTKLKEALAATRGS